MICQYCGKEFTPINKSNPSKYCSRKCYGLNRRKPESEKFQYTPKEPKTKNCLLCGSVFIAKGNAKHCSSCREKNTTQKLHNYWQTEKYKESHRRHAKEWQRNNADKYKASRLVRTHPELLTLIYECRCTATGKHHHHFDYSKPFDVLLLCDHCHAAEHARLRSLTAHAVDDSSKPQVLGHSGLSVHADMTGKASYSLSPRPQEALRHDSGSGDKY